MRKPALSQGRGCRPYIRPYFVRASASGITSRYFCSPAYENAGLIRQAATLYLGLIKNHPWHGGNKRTATILVDAFLMLNGHHVVASLSDIIELVLAIEADHFGVDKIEIWLRPRTQPL